MTDYAELIAEARALAESEPYSSTLLLLEPLAAAIEALVRERDECSAKKTKQYVRMDAAYETAIERAEKAERERDAARATAVLQLRQITELVERNADDGAVIRRERDEARAALQFQSRVRDWIFACFGSAISDHKTERNHRFLEEALELVQAYGCTADEARQLVDYVYGRPVGEPTQEVGGVMVTLAALCAAHGIDMMQCAETELARINAPGVIEKIRAKQAAKPKHGPLPGPTDPALSNKGGRNG